MSEQPTTILSDDQTGLRIDNCVTSGTFSLDGGTWEVDNNVWIIGNGVECAVIDPAHNPQAVVDAVAGRTITHVLLTHGHDDHIAAVREFVELAGTDAQIYMHPEDLSCGARCSRTAPSRNRSRTTSTSSRVRRH